jgi:glycosyltransferase involved in cell wall biosynthesis
MTSITVVTAWQNHMELARDYWNALRHEDCEVLIIDNGSDPPLPNAYRLNYNSGFCYANNVGLQLARTDAVLFANNDIVAVQEGWLEPIRAALEPGVLVGPVLRYDPHGAVDGMPMPYVDGWCLAGMREDLLDLGGFDEEYQEPAYFSDNDLCFRARTSPVLADRRRSPDTPALREVRTGIRHLASVTSGGEHGPGVMEAAQANKRRFDRIVREALEPVAA